jgi:hypothetical protein
MDAKKGDRNIKIYPIGNISAGDKIRLDIESEDHGIEWVTVKSVGTQSVRNTFRAPLAADEDPGTGLDLRERLKFNHSSNLPVSVGEQGSVSLLLLPSHTRATNQYCLLAPELLLTASEHGS